MFAVLLSIGLASAQDPASELFHVTINGADKTNKLSFEDSTNNQVVFASDSGSNQLKVSVNGADVLMVTANASSTSADGAVTASEIQAMGGLSIRGSLIADDMDVDASNPLAQWFLIYVDDFTHSAAGWDKNVTSTCGNAHTKILGGHCKLANDQVSKVYDKLPEHKQVRITARFYFIDDWDDQSGFLKLSDAGSGSAQAPPDQIMWAEQYHWCNAPFTFLCTVGKNVCGQPDYPDRIGRLIDASVPHECQASDPNCGVRVTFGVSGFEGDADPCETSWGISYVMLYVR